MANRTAKISSLKEVQRTIDENGNITETTKETTKKVEVTAEPDYIKLYTKIWCEFNQIPGQWRALFLELVSRMSYADATDLEHSQIVATGGMTRDAICKNLGWGTNMYQKGLKALRDAGAIKQKMKGFYQINPSYAGKGEWKYNPRLSRGGVEDLVATFNFRNQTVDVNIVWADDGTDSDINQIYREGLKVKAGDNTVLSEKRITNDNKASNNLAFASK